MLRKVASLSIGSEVFLKLKIFKILYFVLLDKTFAVKVLVLNNLGYKVFCKVIASFNYPVELWRRKIGIFCVLDGVVSVGDWNNWLFI